MKFTTLADTFHFTSDLHMYHRNICRGSSRWSREDLTNSTRDFSDEYQMTHHIVSQINKTVMWDHHLFILGDLIFQNKTPEAYIAAMKRLDCDNIYIIFGNHDNYENLMLANAILEDSEMKNKFKFIGPYLEIYIDGKMLCLMHYPVENWNNKKENSWHLHGHVHGKFNQHQMLHRLDVGLDSAFDIFKEYKPFSWKEIVKILS